MTSKLRVKENYPKTRLLQTEWDATHRTNYSQGEQMEGWQKMATSQNMARSQIKCIMSVRPEKRNVLHIFRKSHAVI